MAGKIPLKKIRDKIKRFAKGKIAVGLAIALVGFLAFYVPQQANAIEQQVGDSTDQTDVSTVYQYYLLKSVGANADSKVPFWDLVTKAKKAMNGALYGGNSTDINYSDMIQSSSDSNEATKFVSSMVTLNTFNYLQTTTMGVGAVGETAGRILFGSVLAVFGAVNDIVMSLFTGIIGLIAKFNIAVLIGSFIVKTDFASKLGDALGLTPDVMKDWMNIFTSFILISIVALVGWMLRKGGSNIDQSAYNKLKNKILCFIGLPVVMAAGATLITEVADMTPDAYSQPVFARYLLDTKSWALKQNFSLTQANADNIQAGGNNGYVDLGYNPYSGGSESSISKVSSALWNISEYNDGSPFPNVNLAMAYLCGETYDGTTYLNYETSAQSSGCPGSIYDFVKGKNFPTKDLTDFDKNISSRDHPKSEWDAIKEEKPIAKAKDDYVDDKGDLLVPKTRVWTDRYIYGAKNRGDLKSYYAQAPSLEQTFAGAGGNKGQNYYFSDASMYYILSTRFDNDKGTFFLSTKPTGSTQATISNFDSQRTKYYSISMVGIPLLTLFVMLTAPLMTIFVFIAVLVCFLQIGIVDMNLKPFRAWVKGSVLGDLEYAMASLYYVLGITATIIMFTIVPNAVVDVANTLLSAAGDAILGTNTSPDGMRTSISAMFIKAILQLAGFPISLTAIILYCKVPKFREKFNEILMLPWIWASTKGQQLEDSVSSAESAYDKWKGEKDKKYNEKVQKFARRATGDSYVQRGLNRASEKLENKGAFGKSMADKLRAGSDAINSIDRQVLENGARMHRFQAQGVNGDAYHSAAENTMQEIRSLGRTERMRKDLDSLRNDNKKDKDAFVNRLAEHNEDLVSQSDEDKAITKGLDDAEDGLNRQDALLDEQEGILEDSDGMDELNQYEDELNQQENESPDELENDLEDEQQAIDDAQIDEALEDEGDYGAVLPQNELTDESVANKKKAIARKLKGAGVNEEDAKKLTESQAVIDKLGQKELSGKENQLLTKSKQTVSDMTQKHGLDTNSAHQLHGFDATAKRALLKKLSTGDRSKFANAEETIKQLGAKSNLSADDFDRLKDNSQSLNSMAETRIKKDGDKAEFAESLNNASAIMAKSKLSSEEIDRLNADKRTIDELSRKEANGTITDAERTQLKDVSNEYRGLVRKSGLSNGEIESYNLDRDRMDVLIGKNSMSQDEKNAYENARNGFTKLASGSGLSEKEIGRVSDGQKQMTNLMLKSMNTGDSVRYQKANETFNTLADKSGFDLKQKANFKANAQTIARLESKKDLTAEERSLLNETKRKQQVLAGQSSLSSKEIADMEKSVKNMEKAKLGLMSEGDRVRYQKANETFNTLADKSGFDLKQKANFKENAQAIARLESKKDLTAEERSLLDETKRKQQTLASKASLSPQELADMEKSVKTMEKAKLGSMSEGDRVRYQKANETFNTLADKSGFDLKQKANFKENVQTIARLESKKDLTAEESSLLNETKRKQQVLAGQSSLSSQELADMEKSVKNMEKAKFGSMNMGDSVRYQKANETFNTLADKSGFDLKQKANFKENVQTIARLESKKDLTAEESSLLNETKRKQQVLASKASLSPQELADMEKSVKNMEKAKLGSMSEGSRATYVRASNKAFELGNKAGMDAIASKRFNEAQTSVQRLQNKTLNSYDKKALENARSTVNDIKSRAKDKDASEKIQRAIKMQSDVTKDELLKLKNARTSANVKTDILEARQNGVQKRIVSSGDKQRFRQQVEAERKAIAEAKSKVATQIQNVKQERAKVKNSLDEIKTVRADYVKEKKKRTNDARNIAKQQADGIAMMSRSLTGSLMRYQKNPSGQGALKLQKDINSFGKALEKIDGFDAKKDDILGFKFKDLKDNVDALVEDTPISDTDGRQFTFNGQNLDSKELQPMPYDEFLMKSNDFSKADMDIKGVPAPSNEIMQRVKNITNRK